MNYYLNYDKNKDCLKSSLDKHPDLTIFESYEGKGLRYNRPEFEIGGTGFVCKIETNFDFGKASFIRFSAKYKGDQLYCFSDYPGNEYVKPTIYFNVGTSPNDWLSLFNLITTVYEGKDNWNINHAFRWLKERNARTNILYQTVRDITTFYSIVECVSSTSLRTCQPIIDSFLKMCERELPQICTFAEKIKDEYKGRTFDSIFNVYTFLHELNQDQVFLSAIKAKGTKKD